MLSDGWTGKWQGAISYFGEEMVWRKNERIQWLVA